MMQVPVEATAFLGVVGGFLVLLVVFLLYLNRMLCFSTTSADGLPCCGEDWGLDKSVAALRHRKRHPSKDRDHNNVRSAYGIREEDEDDEDTSSDSEEEMLHRLQQSASMTLSASGGGGGLRKTSSGAKSPTTAANGYKAHTPSRSEDVRSKDSGDRSKDSNSDLISLAEKGRVGDNPSGTSETSSQDTQDEEAALQGRNDVRHQQHQQQQQQQQQQQRARYHENRAYAGKSDDESSAQPTSKVLCRYRPPLLDQDDQLFDVSDLHSGALDNVPHVISKCGDLEAAVAYDAPTKKITVRVLQARDLPARDRGGANNVQVKLLLLPSKRQKHKTKIRQGNTPQFNESFLFHRINPEDVTGMGVRFRLYGVERMRRQRMIGESIVALGSLNLDHETTMWLTLEPRTNLTACDSRTDVSSLARSDSTGSTQSMQHGGVPEIFLGLMYSGTTGRLSVEVIKGSHLRNLAMNRAPDTYVKLTLVSSNQQEMAHSKTSIRRGQPNPLFKETFIFQVALFQLPEVTLTVAVYNKRSIKRKEMIGWFSLGLNSSGEEELAHWNEMRDSKGEQVSHWHVLLES